jgi:hypothetical protein
MSTDKIKLIYKESQSSHTSSFIFPIVFILLVVSVFSYLYANIQRKIMHLSWSQQKCNPRYLFFSGFLDPFNKNPWVTTQDNFQKCVSTNIYKDPSLTRVINHNEKTIQKHQDEMKQNLEVSKIYVNALNNEWKETNDQHAKDFLEVENENEKIFDQNNVLYDDILYKTSQMFHVLSSIIRYIQGILLFRVSNYKKNLSIDEQHEYFMTKYIQIYKDYSKAYDLLRTDDSISAINTARTAIEDYHALNKELQDFMEVHYKDINSITEMCYQLQYNMDDTRCLTLFKQINTDWIDHYPMLKHSLKT